MEIPARAISLIQFGGGESNTVPPTISTRPSIHPARGILMMSSHILQGSDGQGTGI
jgi:hypothetical protein